MISPILPLYERMKIKFKHGKGVYLYSENGDKYLDMAAGYAANSFGHCHPRLVSALKKQASKFWHLSNRFEIPGLYEYSKRLVDNTFADTAYVANTGAEAVETAIKMARRYFKAKGVPHKFRLITIEGAFHGRTLACATAGAREKIVGFEPPVDGFDRVAFNDIKAVEDAIRPETMGILLEPIQGEGGMRPHCERYMQELRKLCDKKELLLILDEVQCGAGRTGFFCAYDMYKVKPDLVALAKGIGGGFPISVCLATEEIGLSIAPGTHGSTFGGNPLAIAVANEVLDMLLEDGFFNKVAEVGNYLKDGLEQLARQHGEKIIEIRGRGLMLGIKLYDTVNTTNFINLLAAEKVLSIPASDNVIRFTPPLIIEKKHCDEALRKIDKILSKMATQSIEAI